MIRVAPELLCLQSSALAPLAGIRHGFFTRHGGVSTGIFATLNCGPGSGDDRAAVHENRARCAAALSVSRERLMTLYQVHSPKAVTVSAPWDDRGAPEADAMVTAERGLALGILTADCAPILFADEKAGVIAAAHAGWRGAFDGVIQSTLATMDLLQAVRSRIIAVIGPCIGAAAYEVGPEFEERFRTSDAANTAFFKPAARGRQFLFDLQGFIAAQLSAAGVRRVERIAACTYGEPERFFSYRRATHLRESDYGRNLSAIALTP